VGEKLASNYRLPVATNLFKCFLAAHIAGGTVALFIAPLAMATVKGGLWHRRWGKIYFWAMAEVATTATVMCWLRSGLFLFLIAIFSFYLALTGYRVLERKKAGDKAAALDWFVAAAMVVAGFILIFLGATSTDPAERWVRIIFGGIGLLLGAADMRRFVKPVRPGKEWMMFHMTRFLAAYIATVTAFSVVNFQFLPYFWRWIWPTVIGTAGIAIWRTHYTLKFKRESYAIVR
jgi:multisubunit Na+/H+ antiporter MnhF subunit